MLSILKASAGSGKTYNLAKAYIRLLVTSDKPDAYRHLLAVTFTNKATDEMKRRILRELNTLADKPEDSPYYDDFQKELIETGKFSSARELQERAKRQLSGILHDYSAFAVSTIDRFFQQTLRAFSREVGQFSSYQVQLDRQELVTESVDRLLDSLTEAHQDLLGWLTRGARQDLDLSGSFSVEDGLREMAASIKELPGQRLDFPREKLEEVRGQCDQLVEAFRKQVMDAVQAILDCFAGKGVDPYDTSGHFVTKQLVKYENLSPRDVIEPPTEAFLRSAADPDKWFPKARAHFRGVLEGSLEAPLKAFSDLFDLPYKVYQTARLIRSQVYSMGLARELSDEMVSLQREKNVLSLDDSNVLLRKIIDGSDAPFIYEKMGVRYEAFLLDEFQDTSEIQWENFRPLLHESEASGHDSLVVGDVKQSIYRWRGSDWNLLDSRLEQEFGKTKVTPLTGNYRTCAEIVRFNNELFTWLAGKLDTLLRMDPSQKGSLSSLYADVQQQVCFKNPAPGCVEVLFKENTDAQIQEILDTLHAFQKQGGKWADIAILVRDNADGSAVADALIKDGIPVVSDDCLHVKSSVTVRRLVSRLSLLNQPDAEGRRPSAAGYLARQVPVDIPDHYHSLVDLSERILGAFQAAEPELFEREVPYIQAFLDFLMDWTGLNGNNLGSFLRAWEKADPQIAAPTSGAAVRVMTVHKAKGLEFPFVLLPFAEKTRLYKAPERWCAPQAQGTSMENLSEHLFRVSLDQKKAANSLFAGDYGQECRLQAADALNVFYVAMTRAQYGLKVIANLPAQKYRQAGRESELEWKDLSQLLYAYVGGQDSMTGTPFPPDQVQREKAEAQPLETGFSIFSVTGGERLRFSPEAEDYFGEDGSYGADASVRIRGKVLHGILSAVRRTEDLPAAVDAAVREGLLGAKDRDGTLAFLSGKLEQACLQGWFSPDARVLREAGVIAPDGREFRPDRVEIGPDGRVRVIDYKFGKPEDSYVYQVRRYLDLYRKMGYPEVEGWLWYLTEEENAVVPVK